MSWKLKHAAKSIWHDCLIHPICGILWATRGWWPRVGVLGDRLHCWSVGDLDGRAAVGKAGQ